jgi:hypothetical protein
MNAMAHDPAAARTYVGAFNQGTTAAMAATFPSIRRGAKGSSYGSTNPLC